MDHVAIMRKSWGLLPKILSGQKKIESRWYQTRHCPWGKIKSGETVYFKNAGEPVTVKAQVAKVLTFASLTAERVKQILAQYGRDDGLEQDRIQDFYELFKDKKYCLLVFLKNPQKMAPFKIDKTGFGAMSAWVTVRDIPMIKTIG